MSTVFNAETPQALPCAVVLPCYKVTDQILDVIAKIPDWVDYIIAVDDCCPENSGDLVRRYCHDRRVSVLTLEENQGVGGAVMAGMDHAVELGAKVLVKIDGDGQHDPSLLPLVVNPIQLGQADYVKGNRFFDVSFLKDMPLVRLIGNACISFLSKFSSGYWSVMDPSNGFLAIHSHVYSFVRANEIEKRYLFESDMLFRLNIIQARVHQFPMVAIYGDETSSLNTLSLIWPLSVFHCKSAIKRIFYNYFIRGFSMASIFLISFFISMILSAYLSISLWLSFTSQGVSTPTGYIALLGFFIFIGFTSINNFLMADMNAEPSKPINHYLPPQPPKR